jgi:subtilisin family serine protease
MNQSFNALRKGALSTALGVLLLASCSPDRNVTPEEECLTRPSAQHGRVVEGQYIVAYREDGSATSTGGAAGSRIKAQTERFLGRHRIDDKWVKGYLTGEVNGIVAHLTEGQAAALESDPLVAAVEPDRIVSLSACFTVVDPLRVAWGVRRTGYADGTGKTAWIIDSGIDLDHPDLNVDRTRSLSFIAGKTAEDDNGHGTHVAGIIGAKNNRIGTLGVASGATLVALKVLDQQGDGLLSKVLAAVAHVSTNGKAGDVVNMSLGNDVSNLLDREVQAAAQKGILFAIAAGNDGEKASLNSPARVNHLNVFTVTAMDSTDTWAKFSNFGNDVVDYCAPGVRIQSTHLNGGYATMSGTSMAAPHLAGLLLLRGKAPATGGYVRNDPDGTPDPIASW